MATPDPQIRLFHNDDQAYDDWMAQHEGYVLTNPRRGEYWLHDSECAALGNFRDRRSMTRKPRRWANQRRTLMEWTERETGAGAHICTRCG
jgi:hypothetical protein